MMSHFTPGSEPKAGRCYAGPSAAVIVQLGCDVLDKGAVWSGLPDEG